MCGGKNNGLTIRYLSRKKAETLLMDHIISPTVMQGELEIQVTLSWPLLLLKPQDKINCDILGQLWFLS